AREVPEGGDGGLERPGARAEIGDAGDAVRERLVAADDRDFAGDGEGRRGDAVEGRRAAHLDGGLVAPEAARGAASEDGGGEAHACPWACGAWRSMRKA